MSFFVSDLTIALMVLGGILLMVVEAIVPGFGLPGLAGVALSAAAVAFTWMAHGATAALLLLLGITVVAILLAVVSLRSIRKGKLSKSKLVNHETESNEAGYRSAADLQSLLNRTGTALTVLRPAGMAEIDGKRLDVVSQGAFIPQGTPVVVCQVEGARIVVRPQADA